LARRDFLHPPFEDLLVSLSRHEVGHAEAEGRALALRYAQDEVYWIVFAR
jgi:hypothetical protein